MLLLPLFTSLSSMPPFATYSGLNTFPLLIPLTKAYLHTYICLYAGIRHSSGACVVCCASKFLHSKYTLVACKHQLNSTRRINAFTQSHSASKMDSPSLSLPLRREPACTAALLLKALMMISSIFVFSLYYIIFVFTSVIRRRM